MEIDPNHRTSTDPTGDISPAPLGRSVRRMLLARAALLLLAGVALYLLWPRIVAVFSALPELASVDLGWFALMLLLEIASFGCVWALQRLVLRTSRWFAIATAQLAGNAFSRIVPGGAAAGSAVQYHLLVTSGADAATVATSLTASGLITTATVLALPVLSLPELLWGAGVDHGLVQAAMLGGILLVVGFAGAFVLTVADRPLRALGRLVEALLAVRRERPRVTGLPERLLRQRKELRATLASRWWLALLCTLGNWGFDYLVLITALVAVGQTRPHPALVLVAYVAAQVLAMIPITPGGLGFVEAGLTGGLVLAGVPHGSALVATLAYRLASYWLPLPTGAVAWLLHRRRYGSASVPRDHSASGRVRYT